MPQLLCHLLGDFVLQNHSLANYKVGSSFWATVHALLYTLPFLLLITDWEQWLLIFSSHLLIDRFRLVKYWAHFWGIGRNGWLPVTIHSWVRWQERELSELEMPQPAPPYLESWLYILTDATIHMSLNWIALTYL